LRYSVIIASVLLLLLPLRASGQDAVHDLLQVTEKYGQADVEIAYPGFSAMTQLASRFPVSSCDGKKAVLTLARRDIDDFNKTGIPYTIIKRRETKSVYTAETVAEAMQWKSYPTWRQYDTIMHLIAENWPDVCLLDTIGFSIMGRAILALKISDNVSSDEHEPPVMLSASMHGDELAGFVLMMRLAEYLASHNNDGGLAQKLVSGLEIWINPLSNPDGMYRTYDTILYPVRANSNGYDLNRNTPNPKLAILNP